MIKNKNMHIKRQNEQRTPAKNPKNKEIVAMVLGSHPEGTWGLYSQLDESKQVASTRLLGKCTGPIVSVTPAQEPNFKNGSPDDQIILLIFSWST